VNNFAPLGGIWNGQVVTLHLWSLAVEQQYYLIWPLMVIGLARRPKALLLTAATLSLAAVLTFVLTPDSLYKASLLPTRGFTLVLASTAAIAAAQYRHAIAELPWRLINILGAVLVLIAFILSASNVWSENQVRDRLLPALSTVFVLWIVRLWYLPLLPSTAPFLLNPAIRYIGEISYGIYLYHQLVRVAIWHFGKPAMADWPATLGYVTRLLLYIGLSIAVAALSYELFEKRFLRMRGRFRV
jgi:peptidoglycan/LPS O-acetylase OafA/YrhL